MSPHSPRPAVIDPQAAHNRAVLESGVRTARWPRPDGDTHEPAGPLVAPEPVLGVLERLLLEELPTGRVPDWKPLRPEITAAEAARHRAALEAAVYPTRKRKAA
ncbi:hypothetical protein [Kitasatospora sp. NPDC090091]|uniref:hypothetical protein n=1 Tax=Kitasatospora sp. NPDC090091 TaxID=3364081 RepID=UPI0038202B6F